MYPSPVRDCVLTAVLTTVSSRTPVPCSLSGISPVTIVVPSSPSIKRRLLCKDCHSSFYDTPYWIHSSLRMTQALYDSILLDLIQPLSLKLQDGTRSRRALSSLSSRLSTSAFPQASPRPSVLTNSRETAEYGAQNHTADIAINTITASLTATPILSSMSSTRSPVSISTSTSISSHWSRGNR